MHVLTAFPVQVLVWQTPQVSKEAKAKKRVSFPRLSKQLVQEGGCRRGLQLPEGLFSENSARVPGTKQNVKGKKSDPHSPHCWTDSKQVNGIW